MALGREVGHGMGKGSVTCMPWFYPHAAHADYTPMHPCAHALLQRSRTWSGASSPRLLHRMEWTRSSNVSHCAAVKVLVPGQEGQAKTGGNHGALKFDGLEC